MSAAWCMGICAHRSGNMKDGSIVGRRGMEGGGVG